MTVSSALCSEYVCVTLNVKSWDSAALGGCNRRIVLMN